MALKDGEYKGPKFKLPGSKPKLKGFDGSKKYPEDKIKSRKRVDISTIGSVEEALELLEAGKIDRIDWEDWIDTAFGGER